MALQEPPPAGASSWKDVDEWRPEGACYQSEQWYHWYPELAPSSSVAVQWKRDAIETCLQCSVILLCSQYAEQTKQVAGIWAGNVRTGSLYKNRIQESVEADKEEGS